MDYDEAMDVLRGWDGRTVMVVAFVDPGVSLPPLRGELSVEDEAPGLTRGVIADDVRPPVRIAFPAATFHEASWIPGVEERGLSVVQGATRVDVFLEG